MDSVLEQTPAVSAPATAYRSGFLVGRLLAAGIIVGGLLVLAGIILAVAGSTSGDRGSGGGTSGFDAGAPRTRANPAPSAQAAALADFRRAGLPNLDDCRTDLSALHDDADTAAATYAAGVPDSGALPADAQQASADCRVAADQVARMDVSDPGAMDAREALRRWLLDIVTAADAAHDATDDVASGQYQDALALLQGAQRAFDAGAAEQTIVGQDLGLALG